MLLLLTGAGRVSPALRECDVAGTPFMRALSAALAADGSLRVHGPGEALSGETLAAMEGGLLAVDADVWFPAACAARMLAAARQGEAPLRFSAGGDAVAAWFPAPLARAVLQASESAGATHSASDLVGEAAGGEIELGDGGNAPLRVRTLLDLAECETALLRLRAREAARAGVRIRDLDRVTIRGELRCGTGVEIDAGVLIEGTVTLGDGVKIGAGVILIDCTVGEGCSIRPYSLLENAVVGAGTFVGPYGRLRPGAVIGEGVQIGNFVEVKNAEIGPGSRINHLAFVGDATLGRNVTLGAGTITCNHDRRGAARTVIGEGAYVGSGTELVAPLSVGENATIGAGSTVTRDAPAGELTLARARQVTVPGWRPPGGDPR